eukprot:14730516-Alexandrium_andersonii.AAC.1
MLRSRGSEFWASTYQHGPDYLLFHQDARWPHIYRGSLPRAIAQEIPLHLREGWWAIVSGNLAGPREAPAVATAEWIDLNGRALGFRVPTTEERARALGLEAYLTALGLSRRTLYPCLLYTSDAADDM